MSACIYFSASLFNARENLFNAYLEEKLEASGYTTYFPQRDGFELGLLGDYLRDKVGQKKASTAANVIVYIADMGSILTLCDAVVANLDDPIDEGVAIEIAYAKTLKMPTVGFRTDVRSPFGFPTDALDINCFPVFQCTSYLKLKTPVGAHKQIITTIDCEIQKIVDQLKVDMKKHKKVIPNDPTYNLIVKAYHILFEGIPHLNEPSAITTIADRYIKNEHFFASEMTAVFDYTEGIK